MKIYPKKNSAKKKICPKKKFGQNGVLWNRSQVLKFDPQQFDAVLLQATVPATVWKD
jgi:hypothetical protein